MTGQGLHEVMRQSPRDKGMRCAGVENMAGGAWVGEGNDGKNERRKEERGGDGGG